MSNISSTEIILFAILGAGALVITGAAITRFFVKDDASNGFPQMQDDQLAHMRRVRMRNVMWAEREARRGRGHGHGHGQGQGVVPVENGPSSPLVEHERKRDFSGR